MTDVRGPARSSQLPTTAAALIPLAFLGAFFLWPVASIVWRGLTDSGTLSLDPLLDVARSSTLRGVLWFTFWQAALSTALTALVAAPMTVALGRWKIPARRVSVALVTVPFVLPSVVVAGAFTALLDRLNLSDGEFSLRHSTAAILAAHVFFNLSVVVRTVAPLWGQLDPSAEQAARTLGATPLRSFQEVTWPRLRRAVASALTIVFLFSFTSFALVLILGGPRKATIETEIYRYAVNRTEFDTAAALGVVQLVAVIAMILASMRLRRGSTAGAQVTDRSPGGTDDLRLGPSNPPVGRQSWFVAGALALTAVVVLAPILTLIERSLSGADGLTLSHYRSLTTDVALLPVSAGHALGNSLAFAVVATGLAVVVGGFAAAVIAWGPGRLPRLLDLVILVPLGTSAVTLGFGMLVALDSPIDLRQRWIIVPLAQALIGIPFLVRSVVPVLRSIDDHSRQAAATLGANPQQIRREIDLPVARRALTMGAGFAFAVSIGEFGATSFVGRKPDLLTVPLAIERLLSQPGAILRGQAMALSVILMVVTATILLIADRRGNGSLL